MTGVYLLCFLFFVFFFFKQKTAYEMRISDWSSDVCSSDLVFVVAGLVRRVRPEREAFAVALVGLNPVVLFQSAASGHNDLLVALAIAVALALVFSGDRKSVV